MDIDISHKQFAFAHRIHLQMALHTICWVRGFYLNGGSFSTSSEGLYYIIQSFDQERVDKLLIWSSLSI